MSKLIDDLARQEEQDKKLAIERALTFEKALRSNDIEAIYKAQSMYGNFMSRYQPQTGPGTRKSMVLDPFEISSSMGYYNKNASISFETLRAIRCAPIPAAIIGTRKNQVTEFCKVQEDKYSKGFKIVRRGIKDDKDLTDADKRKIDEICEWILNCGDPNNEDRKWGTDDFDNFMKKLVDDSLTLDAACAEVVPTRGFKPSYFEAVDAATIRFADTHDNKAKEGALKVKGNYPSHVQLHQGTIFAEFYPWEMLYGIRNPTTAIRSNGYGKSELEYMISTVTSMLNGDTYNSNFFKQGSAPKGMLMIKGGQGVNKDRIQEFKRDFTSMAAGVNNSHKTILLDADSFEWVDLHKNNREMEFSKFQQYLIKLLCAIYKISPEEIGFTLEGEKGGLGSRGDGKEEKDYSMSKGLKPLLVELQQWLNKWIVGPLTDGEFELQFVGLDVETPGAEEERINKQVTTYITVDEIRKDRGLKPLPNKMGQYPLNPVFSQMAMGQQQQQQEQESQQQEQDDAQFQNTNPFLDEENPMQKSFNEWFEKNMFEKAA